MLEFLKDCNKNNLYERAMACESHINDFDSITPMAVFFEAALKSVYAECYKNKNTGHIRFIDLLQDPGLKKYLQEEYHFEDPDSTVNNLIRPYSNSYKHSLEAQIVSPLEVKKCFQCVFDFSGHYYAVKTESPVPKWNEEEYQVLLERAIDIRAREKREQYLKEEILQLRDESEKLKKQLCALKKQLEEQKEKNEAELLQHIEPAKRSVQQAIINRLETKVDDYQSQMVKLEEQLKKKEHERKKQEEDIASLQVRVKLAGEDETQQLKQKQEQLDGELQQTMQVIDRLVQQNTELQAQINTAKTEKKAAQQQLHELGRCATDTKMLDRMEKEQAAKEKEHNRLQQQLRKSLHKLEEKESQLCITNGQLEETRQKYLASQKKIARLYEEKTQIENEMTLPKCQHCGSSMKLKPNKNNKSGHYWACSAWKKDCSGCTGSIRWTTPQQKVLVQKLSDIQKQIEDIQSEKFSVPSSVLGQYQAKFVNFQAYPYSFAPEVPTGYMFQSLAVPPEVFPRLKDKFTDLSKFYMCCNRKRSDVPPFERTIYSLVLRLLNRGIVLSASKETAHRLKEKFNERETGTISMLFNYIQYSHPQNPYGSGREQRFAEYWFSQLLGKSWATYVVSQIGFNELACGEEHPFKNQRADFLVSKNGKRIIIELDGAEHVQSAQHDKERDNFLQKRNYTVLRFSNDAVDRHDPAILASLSRALGQEQVLEDDTELDDRYLVACKLTHQLEIAVTKSLEQGYISRDCNLCVTASSSMFSSSELQFILTVAMAELQQLFENYAALYGLDIKWDLLDGKGDSVIIAVGDGSYGQNSITLRDCCLPYNYLCDIRQFDESILPKNCSKEILEFFLAYLFGYDKGFREGQYYAVCRLLYKKDSIILLPTGAGKSVIYQLASFLVPGIIIVISPLTSLIQDQIMNLESNGINNALAIFSAVTEEERRTKKTAISNMRHNAASLLYISPERLFIPSFRANVESMMINNHVYAVSIDEAHCVSEWGHEFRSSYLNIGRTSRKLFQKAGQIPVLFALTGTASNAVLEDIQRDLDIPDMDAVVLPDSFDREELHFRVYQCESRDKDIQIADIIKNKLPQSFGITFEELMHRNDENTKAGIVFTPLATCKIPGKYDASSIQMRLTDMLPEAGIAAYFSRKPNGYSEETWKVSISETAKRFKNNELNLLVATKAFGMGIDKGNIRYVIHDGIPSSFEQYYQEAGRAGRDKKGRAECILLFSAGDETHNEELLDRSLTLSDFTDKFNKYKDLRSHERDDLSTILYFHTKSYKGIDQECELANGILDLLKPRNFMSGQHVSLYMPAVKDKNTLANSWRHAMVRFSVLGIIQDYTYDYNNKFILVLDSIERESLIEHYLDYVSWNDKGRRETEEQKLRAMKEQGMDFAKTVVRILIEYIYDRIEKSRRNTIHDMYFTAKEAANKPIDEQDEFFRQKILEYFSYKGDRRSDLQTLISSKNAGVHILPQLFPLPENLDIFDEEARQMASGIHTAAGRKLESNPDHPGLLLAQAMAEIIMGSYSGKLVASDIAAALKYADERYSIPQKELMSVIRHILNLALYTSGTMFDIVADSISKAGFKHKSLLGPMILDKNLNSTQRDYLLCVYMLGQTTQFLKGETES